MTKTLKFVLAATFLTSPALADNPAETWLSSDQVASDVALAEKAYEAVHPGYDRYTSAEELAGAWNAIEQRAVAEGGMSVGDFYLAVQSVLARIRCDHTKAELPKALAEYRQVEPVYLPLRWTLVEGRALVERAAEGIDIARGEEITAIDGVPVGELVEQVAPLIPVDGFTDHARRAQISQSMEFRGGAVDHFGALLFNPQPVVTLTVAAFDETTREVKIDRVVYKDWVALGTAGARNFKDAVRFDRIGEDAAYIAVDTFVNYREPVDPNTLYQPIFNALAQEGRDKLILDLRRNGGGSDDASQGLLTYLISGEAQLHTDVRVAALDAGDLKGKLRTWDPSALSPDPANFTINEDGTFSFKPEALPALRKIAGQPDAFLGELVVLTSDSQSSGSTNLMTWLKAARDVTLIGERTGGSVDGPTAGVIFFLDLPESGITARIPAFRFYNGAESFEKGMGMNPDIAAPTTVASFRQGDDEALNAAMAHLNLEPRANADDLRALSGNGWKGELTYLNYYADYRSTIPVTASFRNASAEGIQYAISYPGEEHKNAADLLSLSDDGRLIDGAPIISRSLDAQGRLRLTTEEMGEDAERAATIRKTYLISANEFSWSKDVRFEGEDAFFNRNSYRVSR